MVLLVLGVFFFGFQKQAPGQPGGGLFGTLFPSSGERATPVPTPSAPIEGNAGFVSLTNRTEAGLPQWTLIQLGSDPIASLVAFGTTTRYHKNIPENLGHLFERTLPGLDQENRISNLTIQQVAKVVWSPRGNQSVLFYEDDQHAIRKFLVAYNGISTPKTHFLEDSISSVAFSPDGKQIAYINSLPGSDNVFIASTDLKTVKKILDNNIPGFEISWPSPDAVALKSKSSYAAEGFLYLAQTKTGSLRKIAGGAGLDAVWNSDGSGVVYSTVAGLGRALPLQFYDLVKKTTRNLGIASIAEKCVFGKKDKTMLYCAVPQNTPADSFPDSWWQGKISTQDTVVAIDVSSGTQVAAVPTNSDVINPVLFDDDSYLFFIDKNTGYLWAIKTK